MPTGTLDRALQGAGLTPSQTPVHSLGNATPVSMPRPRPGTATAKPKAQQPSAATVAPVSAHHELDEMLRQDPNTGAVGGIRVVLLFNAGLALSGLLGWELWTLLMR